MAAPAAEFMTRVQSSCSSNSSRPKTFMMTCQLH